MGGGCSVKVDGVEQPASGLWEVVLEPASTSSNRTVRIEISKPSTATSVYEVTIVQWPLGKTNWIQEITYQATHINQTFIRPTTNFGQDWLTKVPRDSTTVVISAAKAPYDSIDWAFELIMCTLNRTYDTRDAASNATSCGALATAACIRPVWVDAHKPYTVPLKCKASQPSCQQVLIWVENVYDEGDDNIVACTTMTLSATDDEDDDGPSTPTYSYTNAQFKLALILTSVALILAFGMGIGFNRNCGRKTGDSEAGMEMKEKLLEEGNGKGNLVETMDGRNWVIDFDNIKIVRKIGAGASGQVFEARMAGQALAIKQLFSAMVVEAIGEFQHEAKLLSRLHHPSLIRFYGITIRKGGDTGLPDALFLVMDYCPRSLSDVIASKNFAISDRYGTRLRFPLPTTFPLLSTAHCFPTAFHRTLLSTAHCFPTAFHRTLLSTAHCFPPHTAFPLLSTAHCFPTPFKCLRLSTTIEPYHQ
jgi:hypothetical protein